MEGKPPEMPSATSVRRFKLIWRVFLISNFALGAYIFTLPRKEKPKKKSSKRSEPTEEVTPPPPPPVAPPPQQQEFPPPVTKAAIVRDPIPEVQQREIFKWILEEKRKIKPRNKEEKKRIDEEKAILKQFILSESIPKI